MTDTAQAIAYNIRRKPVRSLRLTVKVPDGTVWVTAPSHVSEQAIDEFVRSKADWIRRHQKRIASLPQAEPLDPSQVEQLRRAVRTEGQALLEYWADRMNLPVPTLTVRHMTSRWGSCNPEKRKVTLNLELGRKDQELLEYVVVHELAHLIEVRHNHAFYAVMDAYLPDWRQRRRILNGR